MRHRNPWVIVIFLAASLAFFQGCVTEKASLRIENSLPPDQLARYNDSFDKLREDLWAKAAFTFRQEQLANLKLADLRFVDGKLRVETKIGNFSKGGLVTKYALRGDFDVQLDCHIDFLEGIYDMDQILCFAVVERGKTLRDNRVFTIAVLKEGGSYRSEIFSGYRDRRGYHPGNWHPIGNFHGTMRIVRIANKISTFYKEEGETGWKKMHTFPSTINDAMVGFGLQNFTVKRTTITAKSAITAEFDNFMINGAQEIIEEEI